MMARRRKWRERPRRWLRSETLIKALLLLAAALAKRRGGSNGAKGRPIGQR